MDKKKLEFENTFSFYGFKFDKKSTWITLGVSAGVLLVLVGLYFIGVDVSWYGVMVGLGFLMALVFAIKLCEEFGLDNELPYTLIWWIFPFSILGARAYYCIFSGVSSFIGFFKVWDGGLAIYGGVIGGAIGLIFCCLIKKLNILKVMDIAAPCLILGQAIGRWGCLFAGCCAGLEVTDKNLQWFPISYVVDGGWHLATFFYESVLCLIGFFVLILIARKVKSIGIATFSYLTYYGIVRYILESLRGDHYQLQLSSGTPISKIVSIICVVIGVAGICFILIRKIRQNEKQ